MPFPPQLRFPQALDNDYTLYLVYNTTETRLCVDNEPWADTIYIAPVSGTDIWADNGFGNIDGELFYYDSVEKNDDGKVIALTGCARQLQGLTKYNRKGEWVRSYVIAEHHNQIVDAILNLENFIGENFDTRHATLDWRIRNLQSLEAITDDFSCPDLDFEFTIIDSNNVTGILASYNISSTQPGAITSFRLDFGDGEFTTTTLSGQHRYALNARIDPIVTASNSRCQIIQTPNTRDNPITPNAVTNPTFTIPVPPPPTVPDFTIIPITPTPIDIVQAPQVTPCPSSSTNPVPSEISLIVPDGFTIPSIITVEDTIPSIITVDMPSIVIDIPNTSIGGGGTSLTMELLSAPLTVDWGNPPTFNFNGPELNTMSTGQVRSVGDIEDLKLILPKKAAPRQNEINEATSLDDLSKLLNRKPDTIQKASGLPTLKEDILKVQELPVRFPDKMPQVELVYNGKPLELKLSMDKIFSADEDGNHPCVMIVPCK